ncbi:hypothetical protein [Flavobacterium sp.]|uniref:hypothetical protein n=1 Tax=Flavobacterium sp. TaxID=239 RepID=UPI00261965DD|nr:hypothetical protein [Flavobacterium sp.]
MELKGRNFYYVLTTISLLWVAFLYFALDVSAQTFIFPDSDNYREAASFLYHDLKSHPYRPLVMSAITGIPYLFGLGDSAVYTFSFFVNVISWLGSSLLLFSLIKNILPERKAFYFTLVFFTLVGCAFIVFHLLTEALFTFCMLLTFYLINKWYHTKTFRYLAFAIAVLLASVLIKPGAKYLSIIAILFFIKPLFKHALKPSALIIYAFGMLIYIQCAMVKKDYGDFTISYIDNVTLYNYIGTRAFLYSKGETFTKYENPRMPYLFSLSYHEAKKVAQADVKEQLKNNKINLVKAYFTNLWNNITTNSTSLNVFSNVYNKSYYQFLRRGMLLTSRIQNLFFSVSGFLLAILYLFKSYKTSPFYSIISFYILYTLLISGVSCFEGDRFTIIFFPAVLLLMAKFYSERSKTHQKHTKHV